MCVSMCSECADIMTGGSRRCIVVSTLAEASFYADNGFDDILYAYCLPFDKVREIIWSSCIYKYIYIGRMKSQEP